MTVEGLLRLNREELDYLFEESDAGPLPNDEMAGTAIVAPGTAITQAVSSLIKFWAWRGKVFNAEHGTLVNQVSPLGLSAIVADVYLGHSIHDEKACIVIDYAKRNVLVTAHLRDEIRLLEDGLYLGKAYGYARPLIHFALQRPRHDDRRSGEAVAAV